MLSFISTNVALVALVAACASVGTGCYVDAQVEPVAAYGYQPQYYNGYVVYYDNEGRPFHYSNGAVSWVPSHSPSYQGYVSHYRANGAAYGRWSAGTGTRYHAYRR